MLQLRVCVYVCVSLDLDLWPLQTADRYGVVCYLFLIHVYEVIFKKWTKGFFVTRQHNINTLTLCCGFVAVAHLQETALPRKAKS